MEAHPRIIQTCKHISTRYQLPGGGGGGEGGVLSAGALTGCKVLQPLGFHRLRAHCEEPPETKQGNRFFYLQRQVDLLQTKRKVAGP